MFKLTTPPRLFAMVSLLMVLIMVVSTGLIQAPFFRQSTIDREAAVVRDMVNALSLSHEVRAADLQDYRSAGAIQRFDNSFGTLRQLPDIARVKLFNRDLVIVWSDHPEMVGTQRTANLAHLKLALQGQIQAVFNPARPGTGLLERLPETIEVYVPVFDTQASDPSQAVMGVLSLYRDPKDLNQTLQHGLYLLWAVIGGAGLLLFLALYKLFCLVYSRQQKAESRFSKLSVEHDRIVQIEKMSAMGELVGEIAHQLNNPLVGVINLTQLAERQVHDPQRVAALLVQVRRAGTECRDIVQRILRINQPSRSAMQPTDMTDLVQDTITFCQHSIDLSHKLVFAPPAQKITLHVDPVLVRQALFNLIHNAVLAAPGQPVQVSLALAARDGVPGAQLAVDDAGPGFDQETAAKLFKPFFTTRASGTGLGLSVAQHIAMKHGGVVLAENLPGGGARFSIWLPVTPPPPAMSATPLATLP